RMSLFTAQLPGTEVPCKRGSLRIYVRTLGRPCAQSSVGVKHLYPGCFFGILRSMRALIQGSCIRTTSIWFSHAVCRSMSCAGPFFPTFACSICRRFSLLGRPLFMYGEKAGWCLPCLGRGDGAWC